MEQTILVTGSTSGFGRLTVETLARQGYRVFAGMRTAAGKNAPAAEELRALAQREQLALHSIEIDVTDDASVERAIAVIIETTGRLDVVVNNAGVSYSGPLEAFTPEQVRQQFETNVFGVLRVNRAVLPQMRKQGSGLLLQIGSIAGRLAMPYLDLYGATKFAVEELTESYRYELAPFGIDAAILEPGTYPTTISANRQVAADAQRLALYQAGLEAFMGRFYAENRSATPPDPQEVADARVFRDFGEAVCARRTILTECGMLLLKNPLCCHFIRSHVVIGLSSLFALPERLEVERIELQGNVLTVVIVSVLPSSCCPLCSQASSHIHSWYQRTLRDVPCAGRQVVLRLSVRKFFCRNPDCTRKIFTERVRRCAFILLVGGVQHY